MGWDPYCAARSIHTGTGRKDLPSPPRDRARAEGGGEAHLSRPRNQAWRSVSHSLHAGLHTHTSGPFREESSPRGSHAMPCNAMDYAERCSDAVLPLRTVSDCNGFAMTASNAGCPLSRGRCGTLTHPKFRRGVRIPRTTQTCRFDRTIMDGQGE